MTSITADNVPETKKITGWVRWFFALFAKSAKLIKFAKSLKIMLSMGSFIAFAFCQSLLNGFAIGLGITSLLMVHEMGHVAAMARKGMPVKLPIFIPFLGAAIVSREIATVDRDTEAYVGFGGPLIGTVGSWLLWATAVYCHSTIMLVIAVMGVFLNLFNMIPLSPLDGGRITQAIHRNAVYVGAVLLVGLTVLMRDPGLLLIWVLVIGGFDRFSFLARFILSFVAYVVMVSMFIVHPVYTHSTNVEARIDSITGGLLVLGAYAAYQVFELHGDGVKPDAPSLRPYPSFDTKVKWSAVWIVAVVFQVLTMAFMIHQLPPNATGKPVQHQAPSVAA